MAGEFEFIQWLRFQQRASAFVPVPPGDDLAVLKWAADDLLLIGADQVLDGVHFDSTVHSPRQIGRKTMNRNLSDCAAMACLPAAAVATVALPRGIGVEYAKELYLGLRDAGDAFDCPIVGGDTGSWGGKLVLTVTILGKSAGIAPVRRDGAKAGDGIYVTGPLGGSINGRHMTFEPRVFLARELARAGGVTAMLDLSDGLSRDLRHICRESGVGAVVDPDAVPIHSDALGGGSITAHAGSFGPGSLTAIDDIKPLLNPGVYDGNESVDQPLRPLDRAMNDGEDYELLFTGRPESLPPGVVRVGTIIAEPGVWLGSVERRRPLDARGWEHLL